MNELSRITPDTAGSYFREQANGLARKQFFLALRDRQLTREESDDLFDLILNLAAIRALDTLAARDTAQS